MVVHEHVIRRSKRMSYRGGDPCVRRGGTASSPSLDKVAERSVRVGERSQGREVSGVDLGGSAARKRRRGERALLMGQAWLPIDLDELG